MLFLHAGIYRSRLRSLVALAPDRGDLPLEPVLIECPRCGDCYLGDLAPDEEPAHLEVLEWKAGELLRRQCPDHAHRVAVSGE